MKKVVIVGGGFAGAKVAKALQKDFDVLLIDNKNYFEFTPSVLRAIVFPKKLKKIHSEHEKYLKRGKFLKGSVKKISEKSITLKDGKKVNFDYLVLASGSEYNAPIKAKDILIAARGENLANYHFELRRAKEIIIVGGGLVGVELAAEIAENHPDKKVTIIHSGEEVLERNSEKTKIAARNFLEKNRVRLVLGERVVKQKDEAVETDKGSQFHYDLCILCTGIKPHSSFVDKKLTNEKGFVIENEFLQIKGKDKVFVCGDVSSVAEEKTAQAAEAQANIVIENIRRLEENKKLLKYKSKRRAMVISLGKKNGILEHKGLVLKGRIPAFMKWFIEKITMLEYQ